MTPLGWLGRKTSTQTKPRPRHTKHLKMVLSYCPKISYTKVSNKMAYANSTDPDQTAPEGAVWSGSTLFAIPLCILRNNCTKSRTKYHLCRLIRIFIVHLDPWLLLECLEKTDQTAWMYSLIRVFAGCICCLVGNVSPGSTGLVLVHFSHDNAYVIQILYSL